jgi:tRNA threonylcarbamoyladenosine biosynthesis protein TsaE
VDNPVSDAQTALSRSPEETHAIGRQLAARLGPGACVALYGDLGSGKTCLVQGVCDGLTVTGPVTSPTFVLVNEYAGWTSNGQPVPVYHFDLYRLTGPDELLDLGWDDYLAREGVCLIEWADRAEGILPEGTLRVEIQAPQERLRRFTFTYGE